MQREVFGTGSGRLVLRFDAHVSGAVEVADRGRIGGAVGDGVRGDGRVEGAQDDERVGVVGADDDVAGRVAGMLDKRGAIVRLVAVVVEMVGFAVGDDRDLGMVLFEAAVGFVGFGNERLAFADMSAVDGGSVGALDGAADRVARCLSAVFEHVGEHRAGGGLAVRARHGDGALAVHEQGEDVAAVHDALVGTVRDDDLRIVRLDGARVNDGVGAGHVLRLLAECDGDAERFETVGLGAALTVGAGDGHAAFVEHFGKDGHTGAADADEMRGAQHVDGLFRSEGRACGVEDDGRCGVCAHETCSL